MQKWINAIKTPFHKTYNGFDESEINRMFSIPIFTVNRLNFKSMKRFTTKVLALSLLLIGINEGVQAQNLNSLKNKAQNKVKQAASSPKQKEDKPQAEKPVKVNEKNVTEILTSTPWQYDEEKLDETNKSAMKDLRLHFGEDNRLSIKYYGSEQAVMQWSVSGKTLTMSQEGESQSFDIVKLSANELHIREQQTGEESFLLAEGYNPNTSNAGSSDKEATSSSAPVSLDFDYRKNQLTYAEEFLKEDATIYQLEIDESRTGYYFDEFHPLAQKLYVHKKLEYFKMNEKADPNEESYDSPHMRILRGFRNSDGAPMYETFYTNYDKGPSAWTPRSSKMRIVENHGEGKKYTEQDALDYNGFMFFDGIAFYASYKRYDGGEIYRLNSHPTGIFVTDKKIAKELTVEMLKEKVLDYLIKGENEPDGFILGLANELHEQDRAMNSIEGKEVKSLKIKTANGETKMPVNYSINLTFEATLADGTVMSTAKKAWMDDYEITVEGATIDNEGKLMCYQFYRGNDFDVSQVLDKVVVTIKSKYHPDVTPAKIELPVDYSQPKMLNLSYAGNPWDGQLGGASLVVEVKKVKNTVDGSDLLEYRLRYKRDAHWYQVVRVKPSNSVFLDCSGFSHGNKTRGDGKDGGDGGDIRLIVDPSAASLNFDYSNKGAKAQPPKSSAYRPGQNGRDGTFEKKTQKVTW